MKNELLKEHICAFNDGEEKCECFVKGMISVLEKEVEYHTKQIAIHKSIINSHSVCPFEWHEGRIKEAEESIVYLKDILQDI